MAAKTLYEALGVPEDATTEQIRSAYRKLAMRYHPDKNPGDAAAEERFKELTQAYEVLSDEKRRAEYDRRRQGGYGPVDFGDLFGGGGGFSIEDILRRHADLFGGFGGGFRGGRIRRRGQDVQAELRIDFIKAARGGPAELQLRVPSLTSEGGEVKRVAVTIPPGTEDGAVLRLGGMGGAGVEGGPPGDLLLRVVVPPHPDFRRVGDDVHVDLHVPAWLAALGGKADVTTLDGSASVRVPPGTSSGRLLRLRGQGIGTGDLLARVMVDVPAEPTGEERALFERLRDLNDSASR